MTPTEASGTPGRLEEELPDSQVRVRQIRDQRQHPEVGNLCLPSCLGKPRPAGASRVAESANLQKFRISGPVDGMMEGMDVTQACVSPALKAVGF